MTRTTALSSVIAFLALTGCYGPRGAIYPYTGNGYTYVSSEMNPVTITLIDTRTEEPFFKMEIPVGKQLTLNFLEGKGDDPVLRPDRMVYAIMDAGTATGRLTNQLTCPPQGSRRIVYDLREAPEAREAPPAYDERIDGVKGAARMVDSPGRRTAPRAALLRVNRGACALREAREVLAALFIVRELIPACAAG